jgi:hypothetical protein
MREDPPKRVQAPLLRRTTIALLPEEFDEKLITTSRECYGVTGAARRASDGAGAILRVIVSKLQISHGKQHQGSSEPEVPNTIRKIHTRSSIPNHRFLWLPARARADTGSAPGPVGPEPPSNRVGSTARVRHPHPIAIPLVGPARSSRSQCAPQPWVRSTAAPNGGPRASLDRRS